MPAVEIRPGTRVMVTGASRGIGRAIAVAFAERGCTLGLVAGPRTSFATLAAELPGEGHEALPADVGDRGEVEAAIERVRQPCDVLVANAGVAALRRVPRPADRGARADDRGSTGSARVYTVHAALPGMLERRRGHLVIVSSGAGFRAFPRGRRLRRHQGGAARLLGEALCARARRHRASGVTIVYPGRDRQRASTRTRATRMPAWRTSGERGRRAGARWRAASSTAVRKRAADAVHYPPLVRSLRVAHGLSPRLGDAILRALRGPSAAPGARSPPASRTLNGAPALPPITPQLARTAKELPEGDEWRYEPKWDGFRTIVFRDGDEVHLQSRNGKPMNRYFPEVVEQIGELRGAAGGARRRDHRRRRRRSRSSTSSASASIRPPRASSGSRTRPRRRYVAFDLLAEGDERLLDLPYDERRERLGGRGRRPRWS